MNLLEKMEKGKEIFLKQHIKKSGTNRYYKHKYYELKDILPIVRCICKQYKLSTMFHREIEDGHQKMVLTITDLESEEKIDFNYFLPESNKTFDDSMKDSGKAGTYSRRYLYIEAFEIVEADLIELTPIEDKKEEDTNLLEINNKIKKELKQENKIYNKENILKIAKEEYPQYYTPLKSELEKTELKLKEKEYVTY